MGIDLSARKKIKPVKAFACVTPQGGINAYWMRPNASMLRKPTERQYFNWKQLHKLGWRIVKVRVTAIGKPR